jgi:hypothetical protein
MKFSQYIAALMILFSMIFASCFNDLDTVPLDPDVVTADKVYTDVKSYKQVLAKVYAGLAVSGQQGAAGQPDIQGIDEGFGQYLRGYWYHQELSTDEALIGWNDQTIKDFHRQTWTDSDGFIYAHYSRIFYQISVCNEFIRETSDEKLAERGSDAALISEVKKYRAEARFLRALSYWHALDLFRNVPFVTENDKVGFFFPKQTNATDLSAYIESELKAIESELAAPKANEYGRADRAAAWMLLAKLYLNHEVYTGVNKYQECLDVCEKVIASGYTLDPIYQNVFLADNHKSSEMIFPITYDGVNTRTWGGTTFVIRAGIGGSMDPAASGVASGWGGVRTTREFVSKFPANTSGLVIAASEGATASYPKIYVPGSHQANPFDPTDLANSLSSPKKDKIFEGHVYFPTANSEFLIARNPTLGGALGDNGNDGKLETGGARIVVPQAGLYFIKVDLNTGKNTYTITKRTWSIIGDAAQGWDTDIPLVWDAGLQALRLKTDLKAGKFKFRANNDWAINLGDTNADAILAENDADIEITKGGGYDILLFVDKPDYTYQLGLTSFDRRGHFYKEGQSLDIADESIFTDGIAINKFKNITSTGVQGSDTDHPDTDFPLFRLADAYLMAAEAILRAGGDKTKALGYVNRVRERAFTGSAGNLSVSDLTLDFILDERARELYWEGHRRTDLIRFGQFADGSYLWQWKGNVKDGAKTESFRNIYPIPSNDINANPNLLQNPGYR